MSHHAKPSASSKVVALCTIGLICALSAFVIGEIVHILWITYVVDSSMTTRSTRVKPTYLDDATLVGLMFGGLTFYGMYQLLRRHGQ